VVSVIVQDKSGEIVRDPVISPVRTAAGEELREKRLEAKVRIVLETRSQVLKEAPMDEEREVFSVDVDHVGETPGSGLDKQPLGVLVLFPVREPNGMFGVPRRIVVLNEPLEAFNLRGRPPGREDEIVRRVVGHEKHKQCSNQGDEQGQ
jgi:hypothetical protein